MEEQIGADGQTRVFTTAGRTYWIDLYDRNDDSGRGDGRQIFADWVKLCLQSFPGSVKVLVTQDLDPDEDDEPKQWVKFRTDMSLPWSSNVAFLGLPTALPEGEEDVQSRDAVLRGATSLTDEQKASQDRNRLLVVAAIGLGVVVLVVSLAPALTALLQRKRQ